MHHVKYHRSCDGDCLVDSEFMSQPTESPGRSTTLSLRLLQLLFCKGYGPWSTIHFSRLSSTTSGTRQTWKCMWLVGRVLISGRWYSGRCGFPKAACHWCLPPTLGLCALLVLLLLHYGVCSCAPLIWLLDLCPTAERVLLVRLFSKEYSFILQSWLWHETIIYLSIFYTQLKSYWRVGNCACLFDYAEPHARVVPRKYKIQA